MCCMRTNWSFKTYSVILSLYPQSFQAFNCNWFFGNPLSKPELSVLSKNCGFGLHLKLLDGKSIPRKSNALTFSFQTRLPPTSPAPGMRRGPSCPRESTRRSPSRHGSTCGASWCTAPLEWRTSPATYREFQTYSLTQWTWTVSDDARCLETIYCFVISYGKSDPCSVGSETVLAVFWLINSCSPNYKVMKDWSWTLSLL